MTSHTPGPWNTQPDAVPPGHVQITVYADADGSRVATVFQEKANAHLIAAAPDLLAALEYALEFLTANDDGEEDVVNRIASAKAAIAKAKNSSVQN